MFLTSSSSFISGVTGGGGGRGAECPPDFPAGNFWRLIRKNEARKKRLKKWEMLRKMEKRRLKIRKKLGKIQKNQKSKEEND